MQLIGIVYRVPRKVFEQRPENAPWPPECRAWGGGVVSAEAEELLMGPQGSIEAGVVAGAYPEPGRPICWPGGALVFLLRGLCYC